MVMYHHENVGQNRNLMIAYEVLENVTKFKYLGKTVRSQNLRS